MTAEISYFDSWDDWDAEWGGTGDSGKSAESPSRTSSRPADNEWGRRPPAGGGPSGSGGSAGLDKDVYIIRGIMEIPLRGRGPLYKLFRGIPVSANNQINISLMQSGNIGHGGGALNGVIFGKIENQALGAGMKVKVQGRRRGNKFVIRKMWDVDSGNVPVYINHYWKDPLDNGRGGSSNPFAVKVSVIFIVIALLALVAFMKGGFTSANLSRLVWIAAVIAILAFIKVFNINIFNNPFVQKVLLFVILVAIALYVPGGDKIMACAIMLFALYYIIKSVFR